MFIECFNLSLQHGHVFILPKEKFTFEKYLMVPLHDGQYILLPCDA
ncbi:hypothetical protein Sps_03391 [Shewanella psychrophila]|uniref:Uncharacterized protein n=1 Tax=Shewanella psychrophila TaxID=225848 RepID=A0A1S6HSN5_9GAMM|nr:hypothetical protein Sps_03391 [Shewanella psychrophila]